MNITQYREMVAQQKAEDSTQKEQPNAQAEPATITTPEPVVQTPAQGEPTPPPTQAETPTQNPQGETTPPNTITIDGKEIPVDEIKEWQNGYLRQSDYTKKTQELAREKEQVQEALNLYNYVKSNPEAAQQVAQQPELQHLDPSAQRVIELENKMYDMMLQNEIQTLQTKYSDFEILDVLKVAQEKNMSNLEDAYLLHRSLRAPTQQQTPVDVDALKAQLRAELLKEAEAEKNTQSLIATNGGAAQVKDNSPVLSDAELKVARMMKMSPDDYATWRDTTKKK